MVDSCLPQRSFWAALSELGSCRGAAQMYKVHHFWETRDWESMHRASLLSRYMSITATKPRHRVQASYKEKQQGVLDCPLPPTATRPRHRQKKWEGEGATQSETPRASTQVPLPSLCDSRVEASNKGRPHRMSHLKATCTPWVRHPRKVARHPRAHREASPHTHMISPQVQSSADCPVDAFLHFRAERARRRRHLCGLT